jgi:hypothetical protein
VGFPGPSGGGGGGLGAGVELGGGSSGGGGAGSSFDDGPGSLLDGGALSGGGGGGSGSGGGGSSIGSVDLDEGIGVVIAIALVLIAVAAVFGVGMYLVWEAPALLAEAGVEFLLAGILAKQSLRMRDPSWAGSVLKSTWKPFLIALVVVAVAAGAVTVACPGARTMRQAYEQCVRDR